MTTLREAAEMALEALDRSDYFGWQSNIPIIKSLREALAQPELEPVAWMVYTLDGKSAFVTDNPTDFGPEHKALPLYTSPPQRKPLTDAEIIMLSKSAGVYSKVNDDCDLLFARAIEKAHGIGETT